MNFFRETDVTVIGGGIMGTVILNELTKYNLRCILLEKKTGLSRRRRRS